MHLFIYLLIYFLQVTFLVPMSYVVAVTLIFSSIVSNCYCLHSYSSAELYYMFVHV